MTLQAQEIRIGNKILFEEEGKIATVRAIDQLGFDVEIDDTHVWIEAETFIGIELTPEWLERFGAIFPYTDKMRLQIGELCFYYSGSGGLFLNDSGWNEAISDHQIYYVHQLQNLYFSLTYKELTLDK